jgi:hypothetical protein
MPALVAYGMTNLNIVGVAFFAMAVVMTGWNAAIALHLRSHSLLLEAPRDQARQHAVVTGAPRRICGQRPGSSTSSDNRPIPLIPLRSRPPGAAHVDIRRLRQPPPGAGMTIDLRSS